MLMCPADAHSPLADYLNRHAAPTAATPAPPPPLSATKLPPSAKRMPPRMQELYPGDDDYREPAVLPALPPEAPPFPLVPPMPEAGPSYTNGHHFNGLPHSAPTFFPPHPGMAHVEHFSQAPSPLPFPGMSPVSTAGSPTRLPPIAMMMGGPSPMQH
jgi:hypothetical protein